jgi:hypothetical protein
MMCFDLWIKNRVIYISRSTAGVWAKFGVATFLPLIVSTSHTTDTKAVTREIYSV